MASFYQEQALKVMWTSELDIQSEDYGLLLSCAWVSKTTTTTINPTNSSRPKPIANIIMAITFFLGRNNPDTYTKLTNAA
jgi:hypothetical protein